MYEFKCPEPVHMLVKLGGGAAEIVAEARDTATVDVAPFDNSDAARDLAANTRVDLRDGRLIVEVPDSSGWPLRFRSPRIRVAIHVPLDSTLQLKVASADATCRGRYASAAVGSASGDIYVEQVTGDASVNTASGDARFVDVGGQLKANAASGDVTVQSVGGEVSAHSASGDLEIAQAGAGVRTTTASGDVRVGAARRGAIKINSASGDVSVGVVEGTGVWLDLTTMSGATRSDLAMNDSTGSNRQDLTLQVRTASGDITVHRVTDSR